MIWFRRRYGIADYGRAFEEFEAGALALALGACPIGHHRGRQFDPWQHDGPHL